MQVFREFVRVVAEAQNPDNDYRSEQDDYDSVPSVGWKDRIRAEYEVEIGKYIAEGVFGTVYEGKLSNGRPVAVKLSDVSSEYIPYAMLKSVRDRLPENVRKHLVEVIFAGTVKGIFRNVWSIVVMERLVGLPVELKQTIFGEMSKESPVSRNSILVDPDMLVRIVSGALHTIPKNHFGFSNQEITTLINGAIYRGRSSAPRGKWHEEIYRPFKTSPNISRVLDAVGDDLEQFLTKRQKPTSMTMPARFVSDFISSVESRLRNTRFPTSYSKTPSKDRPGIAHIPGTAGLLRALIVMAKIEPSLKWDDVHSNNVMMRPGTGDLVVSDMGYFSEQR